jgi:hypothetical protein
MPTVETPEMVVADPLGMRETPRIVSIVMTAKKGREPAHERFDLIKKTEFHQFLEPFRPEFVRDMTCKTANPSLNIQ